MYVVCVEMAESCGGGPGRVQVTEADGPCTQCFLLLLLSFLKNKNGRVTTSTPRCAHTDTPIAKQRLNRLHMDQ